MNVRFDDSLPILVNLIVEHLGESSLETGVVLRDATGRLAFFAAAPLAYQNADALAQRMREKLGPYARPDRILAGGDEIGADKILNDPHVLRISVGGRVVRLVDRRMVGADWLRAPAPPAPPPPRFVFASLKGGVGRSTALAVTAADLASGGLRVLAIDLDIEAPGLGPMLLDDRTLPEFGVLDVLVEDGLAELDDTFLADLIGPSALGGQGRIDVIPVLGRRSLNNPGEILAKIARAYVEDVGPKGRIATLLDQIRRFVDAFSDPTRYDAILIDARAGLHETTASALLGLGAEVFLFGLDESQTWQGLEALFAHLARFIDPKEQTPEWPARLTLVQGKAPVDASLRQAFAERCRDLYTNTLFPALADDTTATRVPLDSFRDIAWDDGAPDSAVLPDEDRSPNPPLAVLDDANYRNFAPLARRDLLTHRVYAATFGDLLAAVRTAIPGLEDYDQ